MFGLVVRLMDFFSKIPPFFTEFGFSIYRENDECNDPLDNFVN
jgi:hypothetical protein